MTDDQVRSFLASRVQAADPNAVVWPRWVLGYDPREWLGVMRPAGSDLAHGWLVTRRRQAVERTGPNQIYSLRTYVVWGFRSFQTGNNTANSEQEFSAALDAVEAALLPGTQFSIAATTVRVQELSFVSDLQPFGNELAHFARGELSLRWSGCAGS